MNILKFNLQFSNLVKDFKVHLSQEKNNIYITLSASPKFKGRGQWKLNLSTNSQWKLKNIKIQSILSYSAKLKTV